MRECRVQGCSNSAKEGKSLCSAHTCFCGKQAKARNMCEAHYRSALKKGLFKTIKLSPLDEEVLGVMRIGSWYTVNEISLLSERESQAIRGRLHQLFNRDLVQKTTHVPTRRDPIKWRKNV
jgi:hypothetical protein